jgi:hypothetical protein
MSNDEQVPSSEEALRLIEQLSYGPNSCDHKLVHSYSLQAIAHVQVARKLLGDITD